MKNLAIIVCLFALSGCTTLFGEAYDKVAGAVENYCEKESYAQRVVYYEEINSRLAAEGHYAAIHCAGDPEDDAE